MRRANSAILSAMCGLVLSAGVVQPAGAGPIFLSDFLGGASGTAVETSNAPYTTVITPASSGGFGVDTLGAFSSGQLIAFEDTDPFDKGIGAHPDSIIDFHLDEFRSSIGSFGQFEAVIGIDPAFGGLHGARFIVAVESSNVFDEVFRLDILFTDSGSTPITIALPTSATTLRLETHLGDSAGGGNHAAWADAKLTVPEPGAFLLVMSGAVLVLLRRRNTNHV